VIYRRYADRRNVAAADVVAADQFLKTQGPIGASWARMLGLEEGTLRNEKALVVLADVGLSLAVCGELKVPIEFEGPARNDRMCTVRLTERPGQSFDFTVSVALPGQRVRAARSPRMDVFQIRRLCIPDKATMRA
jgi:hypothetical protein